MQLVAQPVLFPLGARPRIVVIGGDDPGMAKRETVASGSFSRRLITSRPSLVMARLGHPSQGDGHGQP